MNLKIAVYFSKIYYKLARRKSYENQKKMIFILGKLQEMWHKC